MQMSKANQLIKNPFRLRQLLSIKYSFTPNDYAISSIDNILFGKHSTLKATYDDLYIMNNQTEIMNREYTFDEIKERIPKLTEYYKTYQSFFCKPFITSWRYLEILNKHHEIKAEQFYMKNYHDENDGIETQEVNAYNDDSSSSSRMLTNNHTIFDTLAKEKIDKTNDNDAHVSTITCTQNTHGNQNELYTKRSGNDSLRKIILNFAVSSNPPSKDSVSCYSKRSVMVKKNLMTKEIAKEKNKERNNHQEKENEKNFDVDNDKRKHLPFYKPFLNNNIRMNLVEFNKNLPVALPQGKLQFKKANIISSSRNSNQNSSLIHQKRPRTNQTFDEKFPFKNHLTKPLLKDNSIATNTFLRQTRNNSNSTTTILHHNSSHKSMSSLNYKMAGTVQKFHLSHCSSLTLFKPKPHISLNKKGKVLIPISLNDQCISRNKINDLLSPTVLLKNNTSIKYAPLSKMNTTNKFTKSVDQKDIHPKIMPLNVRAISKDNNNNNNNSKGGIKHGVGLSYKLTKQINDLLKVTKPMGAYIKKKKR